MLVKGPDGKFMAERHQTINFQPVIPGDTIAYITRLNIIHII